MASIMTNLRILLINKSLKDSSLPRSTAPEIIKNMGSSVGSFTADIDLSYKYKRPAGFGQGLIGNDDFINAGLCPEAFE